MMNTILYNHSINDTCLNDDEAGRLILQNIPDAYLLVDPQFTILYFNKTAKDALKRFLGIDICCGVSALDLAPEARKRAIAKIYRDVLRGKTHTTENSFCLPDGSEVFFENTFRPAFNDANEVIAIIIASKDITEKKKAQQLTQESEARLQFALEAANQGAWDWNLQTNEVTYSSSYKKLYGFAENELKEHVSEWITRIHPDDQKKMRDSVAEHLQAEDPVYDSQYRIRAKDGRYRWVMAKGRLLYKAEDGRPLRMIGTHTDITENVERETALKQINERFDCVMKATHDLLWEWDVANNQILRSKESVRKVYGVQDDNSIRKIGDWLQRVHREDLQVVYNTLNDILKAPHHYTFELEYRFRKDNGEYAHIYDRGILLKDEKNKPVRVIGSAQDISERKRLEGELLRNQLEYQRLLHQATVDTQEQERAEIGKELHDNINQVLTTTKLYLDLALTNTELKEELIRKSLQNTNSVIQEIRQLSRSLMDPSIGDLGLVDSINDLIGNIHLTQKVKILFAADPVVDSLLDSNQKLTVFRIIQESLNNVLRHANASEATIDLCIQDEYFHLTLKDNGVGFEPETIKAGAGLKNIQNRIYLINGTLRLESKPNFGCTLQLQFPVSTTN